MNMNRKTGRSGFTLVELLIVIAIIGIVSVLAVQKFGGLKEKAEDKANIANMQRISSGIEAYHLAHLDKSDSAIDRLDSLMVWTKSKDGTGGMWELDDRTRTMFYTNTVGNVGISALHATPNSYAPVYLIGTYFLNNSDATVLKNDIGLTAVMAGLDEYNAITGYGTDDELHSWVQQSVINSPDTCAGYARLCTNGLPVAVINPGATKEDRTPWGVNIYRSCGIEISYTSMGKLYVGGTDCGSSIEGNLAAFKKLMVGDGILMAFGLGERCSLIGSTEGGFTKAPISPVMDPDQYRRYILLIKVKYTASTGKGGGTTYTASSAKIAGVMDPNGNVLSMLQ